MVAIPSAFSYNFIMNALSGMVLMIEQAVGHCGGSEAKTEMIRLSHQDTYGNIVHQAPYKLLDGKLLQVGSAMSPDGGKSEPNF